MMYLRIRLADLFLKISLWFRPSRDCPAGTGWASHSEYQEENKREPQ